MGLSFGDVNGDGYLDLFGSNLGDWASTLLTPLDPVYGDFFNYQLGDSTSRWFPGGPGGVFADPGVGELVATPFGWGTSMADYDNDGDTDIIYHGGLLPGPVVQTAPGVILANDVTGRFSRDSVALADSTDHERRTVQGVAVGDLNDDGFPDVVSVSNFACPRARRSQPTTTTGDRLSTAAVTFRSSSLPTRPSSPCSAGSSSTTAAFRSRSRTPGTATTGSRWRHLARSAPPIGAVSETPWTN